MARKLTDDLCNSCDIKCSVPLTYNEKSRLSPTATNDEQKADEHASCRMALLTAEWRRIIMAGINARTSREKELAAWCRRVKGEYCAWGTGWAR
jgi:hypothetical protein